ncbi:MAG: single-stranded DNA-binding protein [Sedimentisphaerales bacterium]|nr:single-stranded DNA-binding protein [Sedimentisphaerales bacterium]
MAQWNQVTMIGNLTEDPKLSYTPTQTAVCEFRLAANEKYTNVNGTVKDRVCFIGVRCFGKTAEAAHKYLKKGAPVFVAGRLDYEQWQSKDGGNHSKHVVTADTVQFLLARQNEQSES